MNVNLVNVQSKQEGGKMLFKKKATSNSKKPKPKEKKVNDKTKSEQQQTGQTPPPDPLERIRQTQAASAEKGVDVKPTVPEKLKDLKDKKPEEMTGPEQEAVMAGGGVLPKEQAEKEKASMGPTGPVQPPPPGASQK